MCFFYRCMCESYKTLPLYGTGREKTCLPGFANSKGADQPVQLHSLISAIVIGLFESISSRLATS